MLGGGGFDGQVVDGYPQYSGQRCPHVGDVSRQPRGLSYDGGIDVTDVVSRIPDEFDRTLEDDLAVDIPVLVRSVGEMASKVTESGGAEECITDGVNEDVGIAVSLQSERVLDLYTAYPKGSSGNERMNVVSEPNT
jgi:hypothetical protein